MKTTHVIALAAAALLAGFFTGHWCVAQSPQSPSDKAPKSYDFGALQKLYSFESYLQNNGQTNTLERFNDYMNVSMASESYADLGMTLNTLRLFKQGQTDKACQLLESKLDSDIVGFAASYRQLPTANRHETSLKVLEMARDYRRHYPSQSSYPIIDEGVSNAFTILDEK